MLLPSQSSESRGKRHIEQGIASLMRECQGITEKASQRKGLRSHDVQPDKRRATSRASLRDQQVLKLWGGTEGRSIQLELRKVRERGARWGWGRSHRTLLPHLPFRIHGTGTLIGTKQDAPSLTHLPDQPSERCSTECHQPGKEKAQRAKTPPLKSFYKDPIYKIIDIHMYVIYVYCNIIYVIYMFKYIFEYENICMNMNVWVYLLYFTTFSVEPFSLTTAAALV